ncbi:MAG: hypothetical protein EPN99_12665 [Frankiales bacterium]|nr:MAG: hypothetical protein EPN99_12665 [Frankiales bacterium]
MRNRLLAPLTYLALAVLGHLPAFRSLGAMTQCACEDAPQTDWYLGWTPYALSHGRSPWFSQHLVTPEGVNLMWNTLLPLPGLLAWPVTATAGVLASHTLLAVLAFAGSATSMWWVVGRFAPWGWARFSAGLLYGFSPYLVAQGTGHLNLSLVLAPPVVLLLAHELYVRQARRAVVAGVLLGLVAFAQMMTTLEVLASTFVVAVAGTVVLAVQRRRDLDRARVRHAAVGLVTAAGVLTALAAWPLSVLFGGPRAVLEPVQDASPYAADVLGIVVPTIHQVLGTDATLTWGGNDSENGSYLGLPLLVVLVALAWRFRSVAVVRFAAVLGVVAWVLSLGERLHVGGVETGAPLPYSVVAHLPVLHNMAAVRFSLYVVLAAALVLAVGLDRLHAAGRLRPAVALPVALLCTVPLLPDWPYSYERADVPSYFTSDAVERVPDGSLALTYPVPRFPQSAPMLWQVEAGYRYRSVGGYVITPESDGSGTFTGGVTSWERVVGQAPSGRLGAVAPPVIGALLLEMEQLEVRSVLVADVPGADAVAAVVEQVLGRGPDEVTGGVSAWYDVDPRARRVALGLTS